MISSERLRTYCVSFYFVGVIGIFGWGGINLLDAQEELAVIEEQVIELRAEENLLNELNEKRDSFNESDRIEPLLFSESTAHLAGATLLGYAKRIIEDAGGEVQSALISDPKLLSAFLQIGAEISFFSDIHALHEIMLKLSTAKPLIILQRLTVQTTDYDDMSQNLKIYAELVGVTEPLQ